MSENLSPRPRLDDTNSLDDGHSSIDFEIQKLDHPATAKSKPNLKNFPDVEQRSSSPANQNKQLSSGSRSNYSPTTVHGQQSSGTYFGYNQPGGKEKPYGQKYPGWANVQPYQYSEQDPLTGSFKFGYGDQYQWRHEERRTDGVVFGGYGWLDETGQHHVTRFVSDRLGYRVLPEGGEVRIKCYPPA
ncbi:hypothetical protein HAZT_HAZT007507 [Hyalella azteca]|uniref:Cuticle Protein CPR RR Uncl n=1 Tax=Hyalella azteca TaxID=294128 RepID=A0A6A0HB77_HYAAZ|nr:hypothetical protein HAZT_HAZT007507 [Hyalella azteca]